MTKQKLQYIFCLITIMIFSMFTYADAVKKIDSLKKRLAIENVDSNKLKIYLNLMTNFMYYKSEDGIKYKDTAIALAEKLNKKKSVYFIKNIAGKLHWRIGNFKEALLLHNQALQLAITAGDKKFIQMILSSIGQDYADQSQYPKALEYFNKSLSVAKEINDKKAIIDEYSFLAWVNSRMGNFPQAIKYQYSILKIAEQIGNQVTVAQSMLNIANHYEQLGNTEEAKKLWNKAMPLLEKSTNSFDLITVNSYKGRTCINEKKYSEAYRHLSLVLQVAQQMTDKGFIANAYAALGDLYLAQHNYKKAYGNFSKAVENWDAISSGENTATGSLLTARCCIMLKHFALAEKNINRAVALNKKIKSNELTTHYFAITELLDSAKGNWKNAFLNHKKNIRLKEAMNSEENISKMTNLTLQYEFEKKEAVAREEEFKKTAVAKAEISRQKQMRNWIIAGMCVVALLLFFVYRNFRIQLITNRKLKAAQLQLIQNEKLAAIGSVATRMAHEIQNPLNFVNNFSELSDEILNEIIVAASAEEEALLISELNDNLYKIIHHGKRTEAIVVELQKHIDAGTAHEFFEDKNSYLNVV